MSEALLRHEEHRGVHRLVMDHGPNALDGPLTTALRQHLAELVGAGAPPVVLASAHPTLFCPGWDLKVMAEAPRDKVAAFLTEFNGMLLDIFSYPGPTAAEIGGHAVAAGCQMVIACDLRVMSEGTPRLGLSELNLGVPVPGHGLRLLRTRLGSPAVDDLVFRGEGCTASRARELGLVHRTAPPDDLSAVMDQEVTRLAARPRHAFVETKRMLLSAVWEYMDRTVQDEDEAFLNCWFEDETRERMIRVSSRLRG
jgi:enoyl-CoA hydratase/carnithine racemase